MKTLLVKPHRRPRQLFESAAPAAESTIKPVGAVSASPAPTVTAPAKAASGTVNIVKGTQRKNVNATQLQMYQSQGWTIEADPVKESRKFKLVREDNQLYVVDHADNKVPVNSIDEAKEFVKKVNEYKKKKMKKDC